jgi:putative tryptophan/tyrosine transport system substrate-binding protein
VVRTAREAARAKDIKLAVVKATTDAEIDAAFGNLEQLRAGGLIVGPASLFLSRRTQLVALAAQHAVPAIYRHDSYVRAGGLTSYSPDSDTYYRQAGIYAGRILKGEKPADLPVQQPTTIKLVINLKTAKELGFTIPPSVFARVDEVIE